MPILHTLFLLFIKWGRHPERRDAGSWRSTGSSRPASYMERSCLRQSTLQVDLLCSSSPTTRLFLCAACGQLEFLPEHHNVPPQQTLTNDGSFGCDGWLAGWALAEFRVQQASPSALCTSSCCCQALQPEKAALPAEPSKCFYESVYKFGLIVEKSGQQLQLRRGTSPVSPWNKHRLPSAPEEGGGVTTGKVFPP